MKYEISKKFSNDFKHLKKEHREIINERKDIFINILKDESSFHPNLFIQHPEFRISTMKGYRGIYEMTWNFKGPDLRSTFSIEINEFGEEVFVWRRVGNHNIYKNNP